MRAVGIGSGAPVAVLEPDDVVQLGRRDLEDVGVVEGRQTMAGPGREVPAIARAEADRPGLLLWLRHLEVHRAGEDADRLVLHAVVLVAERLSLADVEDLARVAIGPGPDGLVTPGLRDVLRPRGAARAHDRGTPPPSRSRPPYM